MIVTPAIAFLHFQKTGGNHVVKVLDRHFPTEQRGKHNGLPDDVDRPHVWMGIRNPWDWYVSLWAYGCGPKSNLGTMLKMAPKDSAAALVRRHGQRPAEWPVMARHIAAAMSKDAGFWRDCYADSHDPLRFRRWLLALLGPLSAESGEDYSATRIHRFAGVMTARYLRVTSREGVWAKSRGRIADMADVAAYLDRHSVVTRFIRQESLDADVHAGLVEVIGEDAIVATGDLARTNTSDHAGRDFYYDAATRDLVAARDTVIIARHGYRFD
jgi:hypothetical protein